MDSVKRKFNVAEYNKYLEKFIKISQDINRVVSFAKLKSYNLPDGNWFVRNCPDKTVDCWGKFVAWCGFYCKDSLTKDQVIKLVYKKANSINRPLVYDDFRGSGCYDIPFSCIKKYFGTVNKMKAELGLEIIQLKTVALSHDRFIENIDYIKSYIDNNNKDFITEEEIDSLNETYNYVCLNRHTKDNYGISFAEYCDNVGINMGKKGLGIRHIFDDGEETTSQFEYLLSNYLRDNGLKFNEDYFRNIKYKDLDSLYDGAMNCDYKICVNGYDVYIELAGIIRDYKEWYYSDREITNSKSKESYRIKLKEKEGILKRNNLMYFILFPCDLTNNFLHKILHNPSDKLRYEIEKYNQHNIDWQLVKRAS